MPTYEYACTRCGQHVEVYQRLSDEPLTACGACGGPLRKVFHPAGIVFKGSGFYATDSRSTPKTASEGKHEDKKDTAASTTSKDPTPSPTSSSSGASSTPRSSGEKAS